MAPESESRFGQATGDKEWRAQERAEVANVERFEDEVIAPLKAQAISPEAFVGAGTVRRESLDENNTKIAEFKASKEYEQSNDYEARTLEFVLQKMFEDGVFGNIVKYVIKTSEYDDIVRGFDFIVDIGEDEERVPLGIDATVSKNPEVLARKIDRNVVATSRDKLLPAVKYYMDIDGKLKLEQVMPRVILGLDRQTTLRLRDAVLDDPESLEDDPAVKRLIGQMVGQLEFLYSVARPGSTTQKKYGRTLQRLEEMCIEKGLSLDELGQDLKGDDLANPHRLVSRVQ